MGIRTSVQLVRVLEVMLADPTADHYGYPLIRATGLKSGTIYPLLARLEHSGWLSSGWDDVESGPRRRQYRMTAEGQREARLVVARARQERAASTRVLPKPVWVET